MSKFELKRSEWDPQQYYYLSKKDSIMLDELKLSGDPKDKIICNLIIDKAKMSWAEHSASRY
jgi:hypothetical protein